MWIEPISAGVRAATVAHSVAKASPMILKHVNRILYWVTKGKAYIPIFGAGGAGKTTLAEIISSLSPLDLTTPYEESLLTEKIKLKGDVPGKLVVAPGQRARVDLHWPTIFDAILDGKSFGLINVVAYGYHSTQFETYKDHSLYCDGMSVDEFLSAYLNECRQREVELLNRVLDELKKVERPYWMITLVVKQDLWWNQRKAVRDHYENGEYGKHINSFIADGRANRFQHEFIPVSLAISNFKTNNGEVIAPITGGYDTELHLDYLNSFLKNMSDLLSLGAME